MVINWSCIDNANKQKINIFVNPSPEVNFGPILTQKRLNKSWNGKNPSQFKRAMLCGASKILPGILIYING